MGGWLPPGVTDKDIDDAAPHDDEMAQCDCCGKMFPREEIHFIRLPNAAGCETYACSKCCDRDDDDVEGE
jgi:hypothetical protein